MVVTPPHERDQDDRPTGKVVLAPDKCEAEPDEEAPSKPQPTVRSPRALPPMPVRVLPDSSMNNSTAAAATEHSAGPMVRFINSKRITLNFEVTDVGVSGLSAVEVWYTSDGRDWNKIDAPPHKKSYVVGVDTDGKYGFTLLARNGLGVGHEPPAPGDPPQMWVTVDTTPPAVELTEVTPTTHRKAHTVAIRWRATDEHLGRNPISLLYAERADGPWRPIAANLPNNGRYDWKVPTGAPTRLLVRVEATDLAGNVGRAQTSRPLLLDTSRPNVSILAVEPDGR
jgi:hypothetical protein